MSEAIYKEFFDKVGSVLDGKDNDVVRVSIAFLWSETKKKLEAHAERQAKTRNVMTEIMDAGLSFRTTAPIGTKVMYEIFNSRSLFPQKPIFVASSIEQIEEWVDTWEKQS